MSSDLRIPQKDLPETPEQILGPYFPLTPDQQADNNVAGAFPYEDGTKLRVTGRVLGTDGTPLSDILLEAWQCDPNGIYPHPHCPDNEQVDAAFRGYGRYLTGDDGQYYFYALKPVSYPGRAPHLHLKLSRQGRVYLVTQMYLAGEAENQTDFALWRAGGTDERARLIVDIHKNDTGGSDLKAEFNIVISTDGAPS